MTNNKHPYHLVNPSPWPILVSAALLGVTIGAVMFFHSFNKGFFILFFSFLLLLTLTAFWWRDILREGTYLKHHTIEVLTGLRIGFILFIISEIMFFFSFFWAYFHSSLSPNIEIGSQWPPYSLEIIGLSLPIVNTLILLTSGATITVAHLALLRNKRSIIIEALIITLLLAFIFTTIQIYEYRNAPFSISDGIYGSVFYMLTGFHGLHVIIGTIFIFVQFIRLTKKQLQYNSHLGFEASAWYWHFVDVVWLLLFIIVYLNPSVNSFNYPSLSITIPPMPLPSLSSLPLPLLHSSFETDNSILISFYISVGIIILLALYLTFNNFRLLKNNQDNNTTLDDSIWFFSSDSNNNLGQYYSSYDIIKLLKENSYFYGFTREKFIATIDKLRHCNRYSEEENNKAKSYLLDDYDNYHRNRK